MSQYEDPVRLGVGKEFRSNVGRRNFANGDAVDLRAQEKPVGATGIDNRLDHARGVPVLGGDGIEVVSDPMSSFEASKNRQPSDHRKF